LFYSEKTHETPVDAGIITMNDGAIISHRIPPKLLARRVAMSSNCTAAEKVFQQYGERILFYLRGLVGDDHVAEDLLQDVFVNLVKTGALQNPSAINTAYLFRCARNAALNSLDSAGRARRAADGWRHWKLALTSTGSGDADHAEAELLTNALQILDEGIRELVLLRTHADLSFSEIAEILGSPKSTVAEQYAKALQTLKAFLERSGR
jgi:RNA polymerase sigma-70 factor, ECF subfamily